MITSTATESFDRGDRRPDPSREWVFDEVAFHNPEVCSHCFATIRDVEPIDYGDRDPPDIAPDDHRQRDGDGVPGHIWYGDPGVHSVQEGRTYCGECGARSGRADDQTVSRREMLAHTDRLHERLTEHGYPSDLRALKAYVRAAKNHQEQRASDDTRAYRLAVRAMLRRERRQE